MKKITILIIGLSVLPLTIVAQSDCSNPTQIPICPSIMLLNETNAGMGDDAPAPCNIAGEDVVYELSAPNGARQLYVSVVNATGPMTLLLEEMVCGTGLCSSTTIPAGNSNLTFNVSNFNTINTFYLWTDAPNTVTYDISFGADTGSVWINVPNTQGNLQFDSSLCVLPVFNLAKPFYQVTFNGIPQTHPMTLAPLFVPGTMCINTFFKNTTGLEGVKKFLFKFNGLGYASVVGAPTVAGNYNLGNWVNSGSGLNWNYSFQDLLGIGKGDFLGIPNTCLSYEFCFTIVPVSNDPQLTNVDVEIYGDGFGAAFSGWFSSGCCPVPFVNCLLGNLGPGSGAGASGFGFGFADPGGPLPIQLVDFSAQLINDHVDLNWTTASEINNDYFTIQRSANAIEWENLQHIDGAGNSNSPRNYNLSDMHPLEGISYYRLKQTDFNGNTSNSKILKVQKGDFANLKIYPNPAKDFLTLETGVRGLYGLFS
ncbi:MAG: hypothetical protein IPP71_09290 [Bacteroidetes bacterium]|nr:hypothetical protein [Bacteroidota bacterium]